MIVSHKQNIDSRRGAFVYGQIPLKVASIIWFLNKLLQTWESSFPLKLFVDYVGSYIDIML